MNTGRYRISEEKRCIRFHHDIVKILFCTKQNISTVEDKYSYKFMGIYVFINNNIDSQWKYYRKFSGLL